MTSKMNFVGLAIVALLAAQPALAADDPSGTWLTQAGTNLCGTIVWLKQPIDPGTAKPAVDDKNPDRELAKRPVMGLQLFSGMRLDGDNRWSGRIYNADDGQSYESHVSLAGPDSLKVEGCVGTLCGGETWTRSR
jgi:uncharacterized protein (DUF2147 family)